MLLNKGTTQVLLLKRLNKFLSPTTATKQAAQIIQINYFSTLDIGKRDIKPFDYKNKTYTVFSQLFDTTVKRLTDNSLIITVDGNFGSGKSEFAKELAKEIDFIYASELDFDKMVYIRKDNGGNKRELVNKIVGDKEQFRINTIQEWHENPMFKRSIQLQHAHYYCRWMQYRAALIHLFSTGQGVVLERSPFSDQVIAQSLYEHNFMSKEAFNFYKNDLVKQTLCELWKPHVAIYLDRKPENCFKSIEKNGKQFEKNSKVYNIDLLKTIEKNYKKSFIPSNVQDLCFLNYDSNEKVVIEDVITDLESLDLEDIKRFPDWRVRRTSTVDEYRTRISNDKWAQNLFENCFGYINVPEYLVYGEDLVSLIEKVEKDSKFSYEENYTEHTSYFNKAFDFIKGKKPNVDWL